MPIYEMVREIQNSCPNNQMRDVSFQEVVTAIRRITFAASCGASPSASIPKPTVTDLWKFGPIVTACASVFSLHLKNPCENRGEN